MNVSVCAGPAYCKWSLGEGSLIKSATCSSKYVRETFEHTFQLEGVEGVEPTDWKEKKLRETTLDVP